MEEIDDLRPVLNGAEDQRRSDDSSWTVKDADTGHENHEALWKNLSPNHWPTLFALYNVSLTGRCVTSLSSCSCVIDDLQQSLLAVLLYHLLLV